MKRFLLLLLLLALPSVAAQEFILIDLFNGSGQFQGNDFLTVDVSSDGSVTRSATETGGFLQLYRGGSTPANPGPGTTDVLLNGTLFYNVNQNIELYTSRVIGDTDTNFDASTNSLAYVRVRDESGNSVNILEAERGVDFDETNITFRFMPKLNQVAYSNDGFATNTTVDISSLQDSEEWYVWFRSQLGSTVGGRDTYLYLYDLYVRPANFSTLLLDERSGDYVEAYNVTINGTTYATEDFIAYTEIFSDSEALVNITYSAFGYINQTFQNVNISQLQHLGNISPAFRIYAYDEWNNQSLTTIGATIDGYDYSSNNGDIITNISFDAGNKTITINASDNGGYNEKTLTHNVTSDLNTSLHQLLLEIRARNFQTGTAITTFNVTVTDGVVSKSATTTDGSIFFNIRQDSYTATASSGNFQAGNQTFSTTALIDQLVTVDIFPLYNISLINEITNDFFDVNAADEVRLYLDDNSSFFDFKAAGLPYYSVPITNDTQYRLQLEYATGDIIQRFIDLSLFPDEQDIRVCANNDTVTHYEQLITSATERPVKLVSTFADCYVAADYTRFAYQNSKILKAFTTDTQYHLRAIENGDEILLASIDGSVATFINVDVLEFQQDSTNLQINSEVLATEIYIDGNGDKTNTSIIFYKDFNEDNQQVTFLIYRTDTGELVLNTTDFITPNNQTIYFDTTSLSGTDEETLYRIVVQAINVDGTTTQFERFFNQLASSILRPEVAFALSALIFIFGFTLTVASLNFSWFGILISLTSIIVAGLGGQQWYLLLMQGVYVIVLVFVCIKMIQGNSAQVS